VKKGNKREKKRLEKGLREDVRKRERGQRGRRWVGE
jgi:hypothetical protein